MDAAFLLDDVSRRQFFRSLMQSFGCVYVCLWSYAPHPHNCLISIDGYYNEVEDQPSSSSGSVAQRRFDEYRHLVLLLEDDHVPGLAFSNSRTYMELGAPEIQRLAHNNTQRLFYQEARIQTAVFMGCRSGEIEMGISYNTTQMNLEMGLREWFPEDFLGKSSVQPELLSQPAEQSRQLSSSSSSLRSLDSPNISDYSSLLFTMTPSTSQKLPEISSSLIGEVSLPPIPSPLLPASTSMIQSQTAIQQAQAQALAEILPLRERENEAMTRAILAVLTSTSSTSSTSSSPQQQQQQQLRPRGSAFKRYHNTRPVGRPSTSLRRQSMIKRALLYYQRLSIVRREHLMMGSRGPTSTQLHHMISERRRREKLNESFQALRLLLPQGTKRDKASVLAGAREQLTSLQAEVSKLIQRNRELEAQLARQREFETLSSNERFNVRVRHVPESTSSDERIVDLSVILRGTNVTNDLVTLLLEFLKQDRSVSLISVEARSQVDDEASNTSLNLVNLRLKIEGVWDEPAFLEAVRRVVADLAH